MSGASWLLIQDISHALRCHSISDILWCKGKRRRQHATNGRHAYLSYLSMRRRPSLVPYTMPTPGTG